MKKIKISICLCLIFMVITFTVNVSAQEKGMHRPFGIVLHGGAGLLSKKIMPEEKEKAYREKLKEALAAGYRILKKGGKSLDAVEAAIRILEDSPLFNAGKGAVFTGEGTNELDASIMDGKTLNAGAVAGVQHIKNPISLARMVMERSPHVLLSREGAEAFAKKMGLGLVPKEYFFTKRRWESLQKIKEKEKKSQKNKKFGTVGAAALDKAGNLAAGTSTGGMTNKKFGRVGDSPLIGAGTYANNRTCAISATGHGEYFIRSVAAYDISALMEYGGLSLNEAAQLVVMKKLKEMGGYGGIIAIDYKGNISMPFNTSGMFRGYVGQDGKVYIKIFKNL